MIIRDNKKIVYDIKIKGIYLKVCEKNKFV